MYLRGRSTWKRNSTMTKEERNLNLKEMIQGFEKGITFSFSSIKA